MARPDQAKRIGRFGDYWLLRRLGESGMGELWIACSAKDVSGRSICALKRPLPFRLAEPESVQGFLDEIRLTDMLSHPNINRILDAGIVDGEPFFAMEYVEGKTIGEVLRMLRGMGRNFPLPLAAHLGVAVCDALSYAHTLTGGNGRQIHLIHRGLDPESLFISYAGAVKIIEFGTATSRLKESQTLPGARPPDTTYQSPEYMTGKGIDARSDIYSLGVVLWELCSGQSPVQSPAEKSLWLKSGRERFASPSKFRTGVPQQLDYVVMRAVSNDPRERFQNAADMGAALKGLLDELAPGYEETADRQMSQFMRSIFDSVWLSERQQLMKALQSVQRQASSMHAQELRRRQEDAGYDDDDDDERTVALIDDSEMQDFDRSEPFTDPGVKRKGSRGGGQRRSSGRALQAVRNVTGDGPAICHPAKGKAKSAKARNEIIRTMGMALGVSLAIALAIAAILVLSGGHP